MDLKTSTIKASSIAKIESNQRPGHWRDKKEKQVRPFMQKSFDRKMRVLRFEHNICKECGKLENERLPGTCNVWPLI